MASRFSRPRRFARILLLGAGAAAALSFAPAASVAADGCGPGAHRGFGGHCRTNFNRFRHHDEFRRMRHRHCTTLDTPNGTVRRCRI